MNYAIRNSRKSHFISSQDALNYYLNGWEIPDFYYLINEWGFRGEFDPDKDMCIGDSRTFGWGLPEHETYAHLLNCNNFGICGAGWQTFLRVLEDWVLQNPTYNPKNIYLLESWPSRREIKIGDEYIIWGDWLSSMFTELPKELHTDNESANNVIREKCLRGIERICSDYKINLIYASHDKIIPSDRKAIDGAHPSKNWHIDIFNYFSQQ